MFQLRRGAVTHFPCLASQRPLSKPSMGWGPGCLCGSRKMAAPSPEKKTWEAHVTSCRHCLLGEVGHSSHAAGEGSVGAQHLQTEPKCQCD